MKYALVVFPSKKLQDLANSYRKRYDPKYALIPPHITLKAAFEASEEEAEIFRGQLKEIAKKYNPFLLKVTKVKSFEPVSNTIYFKVEPAPELEGLFADFRDRLPGGPPPYPFVPHITIGQELSKEEHADVFRQLEMVGIDHEEKVNRFHLLYQLENGIWTVYETYHLGKD
ncbi:2'-5' RNA ligase family protein [Heyndrickxia coagulans]|uniref:2'-5' RNA ligase family protein n=1 Tax=Heyndrickxia coagulans TaxID=1398 RepID=UPI002235F3EF|nr:2'-5' RNA ligase family protein [Heyndrickxia coagulans]UZH07434.1 2'-5' RNA ligase family protein [Heyndrickxia coagulans]